MNIIVLISGRNFIASTQKCRNSLRNILFGFYIICNFILCRVLSSEAEIYMHSSADIFIGKCWRNMHIKHGGRIKTMRWGIMDESRRNVLRRGPGEGGGRGLGLLPCRMYCSFQTGLLVIWKSVWHNFLAFLTKCLHLPCGNAEECFTFISWHTWKKGKNYQWSFVKSCTSLWLALRHWYFLYKNWPQSYSIYMNL